MRWWLVSMLWGCGGALISILQTYSTCYERYRVAPWNVPPAESFPGSEELTVTNPVYYVIDAIANLAVGGLVCAAASYGFPRSAWFAILYLMVGAGGTKAMAWALRLIKIVAADPGLLGEASMSSDGPAIPGSRGRKAERSLEGEADAS